MLDLLFQFTITPDGPDYLSGRLDKGSEPSFADGGEVQETDEGSGSLKTAGGTWTFQQTAFATIWRRSGSEAHDLLAAPAAFAPHNDAGRHPNPDARCFAVFVFGSPLP